MLDFSEHDTDSPEVIEFKERVEKTARKFADRYGWCEQVDLALRELGIGLEKRAEVSFTLDNGMQAQIEVKINDFQHFESQEQQFDALSLMIAEMLKASGIKTTVTVKEAVVLPPKEEPIKDAPPGYVWAYSSDKGRVLHLFSEYSDHYRWSVCGSVSTSGPARHLHRTTAGRHLNWDGTPRKCKHCEAAYDD